MLTEVDGEGNPVFQAVEGNYDMRDVLREPAQRRGLSATEKAERTLRAIPGISEDMVAQFLAQIRAQSVTA